MKPISDDEYLESKLIGTILNFPNSYIDAADVVRITDFATGEAVQVWAAISKHWKADLSGADLQCLVYPSLSSQQSKQFFFSATNEIIPLPSMAKGTAQEISKSSKRRRVATALAALSEKAKNPTNDPEWLLEDLLALHRMESGNVDTDVSIGAVVNRFKGVQGANRTRGSVGLKTGFDLFQQDHIVYQPGHLWVIGAWTSTGKSAYMIEAISRFFAENTEGKVAVFSTEMTEEQNVARLLANQTGVNANVILSGNMLDHHQGSVEKQAEKLSERKLHIYTKTRNIDDIMSQCRKLKHSGGIDLVWIDFIQNVSRPGYSTQYAMMSQIAIDLQSLAHDLGCTVLCLSQLPNHAGREDTGILEFKGAGEIAAACDIGVLMKRSKEDNSIILFDVRKNRHGKCGKYLLQFTDGWTRIEEKEVVA